MHGKYTLPVITMNGKAYMCIYNSMPDVVLAKDPYNLHK